MTNFPTSLDDDGSIIRVDDAISELGGMAIDMLRSAVFAIELNLGLTAAGSLSDLSTRLNVSLNPDGTIKASALNSVGLVTLPVTNAQIGTNAGILESKLHLDFGTSNLNTLIQAQSVLLTSLSAFEAALETKVNSHIAGGPASNLRHTASMIDINAVPSDSRDPGFTWPGLINKDGYQLTATNVASALEQVNTDLTSHQNQVKDAHPASAISVDTSGFTELLENSESVQDVLDNIDDIELLQLGTHRATQHTNGIPKAARSLNLSSATTLGSDGYNLQVLPPTPCETFVVHNPPGTAPIDSVSNGDSIVSFKPTSNTGSVFDALFSQVHVGDIVRINYANGTIEDIRRVESIRYNPGVEWVIRINGVNLVDSDGYGSIARIDRPLYDSNIQGVLAVASANAVPLANYSILGSLIIGDPRGATAFGMNFDATKINQGNYNLYLELYPTGNPADHVIKMPAIDVSGNNGVTPGVYNIDNVVTTINDGFRATGYNYRFIAFSVSGNIGIMLADSVDGASFAIISGDNSSGTLVEGIYTENVVGDVYGLHQDAFGFGVENANLASPAYQASWLDPTAAQFPTIVIHPVKARNYIVNGRPFDLFAAKELTTNGFWVADIDSKTVTGSSVEVTYKISSVLASAGLKAGKTILVQPAVAFTDPLYSDVDYGRFIIKSVIFNNCNCVNDYTLITVINGVHGTGNALSAAGNVGLPVRIYFDEGSVSFDDQNIIDTSDTSLNYHRFHEIYITDAKTTFTHERARLPYTSETSQLIDTNSWHVLSVSPKFRGYTDLSGTALNKYIRLYISNYNSVSGEFDGYLGQRQTLGPILLHPGQIVRGRKNLPVKFYDDTNVDFIELIFRDETTASPGLTLPINKWMDIEVFPSLLLDQELLPLATCEVNWNPVFGKNCIEYVRNLKQYGSISELEFTQSAVDFITAGERYLHQNGIVYGFDPEVDIVHGKFLLHGGIALVNGKIITTNNVFLSLPFITSTTTPPQTLNWAVCVDDNGLIKSFPLTDTKTQFFASYEFNVTDYYIPSYSFIELQSKKNLAILYIANVTLSNVFPFFSFNSYSDARKFIKNETALIPLTWVGKDGADGDTSVTTELVGHFTTFNQVATWINWTKSPQNVIKLRGTITSNSMLDFSSINYPTVFDGENGCVLNLNSARGIKIGSNVEFRNIGFNWSPGTLTYTSGDNVNLDSDGDAGTDDSNGCLYAVCNDGYILNNINVNNCTFTGTFPQTQRPPYITIIFGGANANIDSVNIIGNKFNDPNGITNQSAIAIALLGIEDSSAGVNDPLLSNSLIEKNVANNNQNIVVTMLNIGPPNAASFSCRNTIIQRNNVGAIGYLITSDFINSNDTYKLDYGFDGLKICNNTTLFIGSLDSTGHILNPNNNTVPLNLLGTGDITIADNNTSVIYCNYYPNNALFADSVQNTNRGESLLISNNRLRAKLVTEVNSIYGLNHSNLNEYTAIYVDGFWFNSNGANVTFDTRVAQILNNNICYYTDSTQTTNSYQNGIYVDSCAANITGNIIKNFSTSGIFVDNDLTRDVPVNVNITNNQLYNFLQTAQPYIGIDDSIGSMVRFKVVDNYFDTYTTNGDPSFMISIGTGIPLNYYLVRDNFNQTDSISLRAMDIGKVVDATSFGGQNVYYDLAYAVSPGVADIPTNIASIFYGPTETIETLSGNANAQLTCTINGSPNGGTLAWLVPLSILNRNVKFVSASLNFTLSDVTPIGPKTVQMQLISRANDDAVLFTAPNSNFSGLSGSGNVTITAPDPNNPISLQDGDYIKVFANVSSSATGAVTTFNLEPLILTFRY